MTGDERVELKREYGKEKRTKTKGQREEGKRKDKRERKMIERGERERTTTRCCDQFMVTVNRGHIPPPD